MYLEGEGVFFWGLGYIFLLYLVSQVLFRFCFLLGVRMDMGCRIMSLVQYFVFYYVCIRVLCCVMQSLCIYISVCIERILGGIFVSIFMNVNLFRYVYEYVYMYICNYDSMFVYLYEYMWV